MSVVFWPQMCLTGRGYEIEWIYIWRFSKSMMYLSNLNTIEIILVVSNSS